MVEDCAKYQNLFEFNLSLEVQPWNFSDTFILNQLSVEFIEHDKTADRTSKIFIIFNV